MGGIRVGGAREGEISKIIGGPDEIALLGKERKVYTSAVSGTMAHIVIMF